MRSLPKSSATLLGLLLAATAVTGVTRELPEFTMTDKNAVVPLTLAACQSGFVLFRKKAAVDQSGKVNI